MRTLAPILLVLLGSVALGQELPRRWKVKSPSQRRAAAALQARAAELEKAHRQLEELEAANARELAEVVAEIRSDVGIPVEIPTAALRWVDGSFAELEVAPVASTR